MIRKVVCVVSMAAHVAAAGSLPHSFTRVAYPATRPTEPVHSFTATDLPLNLRGATGEQATWLAAFAHTPQQFDYTMQLVEDEDGIQVYRVVFQSPFKSPFPQNNVVPAEYYLPKDRNGKVAAAVVLDIMQGNALVPRGLARGLASQGIAALYMPMAYYNQRRPAGDAHTRWFDDKPERTVDPVRQTVMDIRRAKSILASRPEVDPERVGITGVSLGGIMTSIAAGVDGEFFRVVPILAGGNLPALIFHAPETRKVKERLIEKGLDEEKLRPMLASVEPLNFASRIDPSRCMMINARKDEVIPGDCTTQLWEAIGKPTLLWVPSGHYTAALYLPTIKQTAIDFLKGKPVQKLEY